MNDHQTRFLKILEQAPRTFLDFTNGTEINTVLAPHIVGSYLGSMVKDGLIELTGDVYSITPAGRRELHAKPVDAPARTHGNYSMASGSLRLNYPPPARAGADSHLKHKSRGF
jgi:hypothetical protein